MRDHEHEGKYVGTYHKIWFYYFKLDTLKSRREEKLKQLRDLVDQIHNDKTIKLDKSSEANLKGWRDWANGDRQNASFSDIAKRYNDAQQHVC